MSLFTQWVPADWSDAPHTEELEAYADRLIDLYDAGRAELHGRRSRIATSSARTRWRQEYGLIGGNIFHGELSLEQLFHMRPAPGFADYRTPIAGLYNASSATHAGGGVCGIPGWQAARGRAEGPEARLVLRRRAGRPRFVTDARAVGGDAAGPIGRDRRRERARPGTLRRAHDHRDGRQHGRAARRSWSTRATTGSAADRACRRWPTSTSPSTSSCSAFPTTRCPTSCAAAVEIGARGRRCMFGSRARCRPARVRRARSRATAAWRCAAPAAWASSTSPTGVRATGYLERHPPAGVARSRWSRTRVRCSRLCCARAARSAERSRCRRGRRW